MTDITLFKSAGNIFLKEISRKDESIFHDSDGFLLNMDEKEARRTIESLKSKGKKIAILARDDEFNRRALETLKVDYLVSPENNPGKDNLKQRSSGFNHVMAEIAKKKNIQIVVDLNWLNSIQDKKQKAIAVSRIIQNIKICRKAKIDLKLASFAKNEDEILDEKQIKSIGFSLGMSSQQVNNCLIK
jgi:RNase P/RNase MRP subunit p30